MGGGYTKNIHPFFVCQIIIIIVVIPACLKLIVCTPPTHPPQARNGFFFRNRNSEFPPLVVPLACTWQNCRRARELGNPPGPKPFTVTGMGLRHLPKANRSGL